MKKIILAIAITSLCLSVIAQDRFTVTEGNFNQSSTVDNWGSGSNTGAIVFNFDGRSTPTGSSQNLFRDFYIYNGKGQIMSFFDGSSQRVGIGTTSPLDKLHVSGTSANEIIWPIVAHNPYNNSTTNEYGVGIKLKHSSNNESGKWSGIASVNEGGWANNSGLALFSDATEKVRIKHNGYVGIGTTSPGTQLHVEKSSGALLRLSNDQNNYLYSGIDALGAYIEQVSNTSGKSKIRLQVRNANQGTYSQFFINGENNSFNLMNGNVGVGTSQPGEKLQIGDAFTFHDGGHEVLGFGCKGSGSTDLNPNAYASEIRLDPVNGNFRFAVSSGLSDYPQTRLTIKNNGAVGIGTMTTGTHRLAVEGSIGAREIKVEASGWSDFVFEKDYDLPTLEEVEKHIEENGHLPEIPSHQEVTENGINLGEMDAKLLQKIEELTLYLIDVNKRVNELESENKELKEKVNQLESE